LHNIDDHESRKICEHGCVKVTIVRTEDKDTVASIHATGNAIPCEVDIHSPCCPTNGQYKLSVCPIGHENWCFVKNGPEWEDEMNRICLDIAATVDEKDSNYCGPAANVILAQSRFHGWYKLGSSRHPHHPLLINIGEAVFIILLAWYSSAGPLLCGVAARKSISRFWNGSNNRGMSLALLEDDAYILINERGYTTYAVTQSNSHTMLLKIMWISFVNVIATLGAYSIMEIKSRVINPNSGNSEKMELERKITIVILAAVIFFICIMICVRPRGEKTKEVRGGRLLAALTGLVAVGSCIAPWLIKDGIYKNIRLVLEIFCMIEIILIKIAWWGQQYVHGGAIDPKNYLGIESAVYILSGLASLYIINDLYSS